MANSRTDYSVGNELRCVYSYHSVYKYNNVKALKKNLAWSVDLFNMWSGVYCQ